MQEGSVIPRQVVLEYIRKVVKHRSKSKLVSNVLLQFLLQVPSLSSHPDFTQCYLEVEAEINSFLLSKWLLVMVFITVTEL